MRGVVLSSYACFGRAKIRWRPSREIPVSLSSVGERVRFLRERHFVSYMSELRPLPSSPVTARNGR